MILKLSPLQVPEENIKSVKLSEVKMEIFDHIQGDISLTLAKDLLQ